MSTMPDFKKPRWLENQNCEQLRSFLRTGPAALTREQKDELSQWAIHLELRSREMAHPTTQNFNAGN